MSETKQRVKEIRERWSPNERGFLWVTEESLAHAPEDIAFLLAELDKLEKERDDARAQSLYSAQVWKEETDEALAELAVLKAEGARLAPETVAFLRAASEVQPTVYHAGRAHAETTARNAWHRAGCPDLPRDDEDQS